MDKLKQEEITLENVYNALNNEQRKEIRELLQANQKENNDNRTNS